MIATSPKNSLNTHLKLAIREYNGGHQGTSVQGQTQPTRNDFNPHGCRISVQRVQR